MFTIGTNAFSKCVAPRTKNRHAVQTSKTFFPLINRNSIRHENANCSKVLPVGDSMPPVIDWVRLCTHGLRCH